MDTVDHHDEDLKALRELYQELTDAELEEADKNLDKYVAILAHIFERIHGENAARAAYAEIRRRLKTGQSLEMEKRPPEKPESSIPLRGRLF